MSRTVSHQRTRKFYSLQKQVQASVIGPKKKAPLMDKAAEYTLEFQRVTLDKNGFTEYEIENKIANRYGHERKAKAALKTKNRRIEKRSEKQKVRNHVYDEIECVCDIE